MFKLPFISPWAHVSDRKLTTLDCELSVSKNRLICILFRLSNLFALKTVIGAIESEDQVII